MKKAKIKYSEKYQNWVIVAPMDMKTLIKMILMVLIPAILWGMAFNVHALDEPCLQAEDYIACKDAQWKAQDLFYATENHPYSFAECFFVSLPKNAIDVTEKWVEYKEGRNALFYGYLQRINYYKVDGIWYASQGSKDGSLLIYAGWWRDEKESYPGVRVGHPSCGVYILYP